MKLLLASLITAAVLAPAASAAGQAWYWSPTKMEAAIRPEITAVRGPHSSLDCQGYGASTYAEDDTQLFNRFQCRVRSYAAHLAMRIEYVKTRATGRFSYVIVTTKAR